MLAFSACTQTSEVPCTDLGFHKSYAYVGEWDTRNPDKQNLRIITDGKISFEYSLPIRDEWDRVQEFDDVFVLPDGNILYAAMSQLGKLSPDGKLLWQYICPQGTESHSLQPLDGDRVYFALNGVPGKIVIWNTATNECEKEIVVPTEGTNTHGQFRHVRRTAEGNFTTGLFVEGKVVELNEDGEIVNSFDAKKVWQVEKLANGNYLTACDNLCKVVEVNADGETVWEFTQEDAPFELFNTQTATRLDNGNTLICCWVAGQPEENWPGTVQFFEVTPDKNVVWQVSQWENPDLGPCTYLQILEK